MNELIFSNALKYRLSRHVLFFSVVVLVFTLVLYSRNSEHSFWYQFNLTFINSLFFLGYGYLTVFILIPFILSKGKLVLFGFSFVILGLVLSVVKLSISDYIFYSAISPEFDGSSGLINARYILINTKDMSFIVFLLVIARFSKNWIIAEKQHQKLQKKYAELKLKLLQSHFEPHFLFNTLNNIYALSLKNLDETYDIIRRFRNILQFSIEDARHDKVLLLKEIDAINDYIRIEYLRYGSRLKLNNTVTGEISKQEIAPFVLLSLVENCFKNGSSTDAGNPRIELNLKCKNQHIYFETKNSVSGNKTIIKMEENKELLRLKNRLELIYPGKYILGVSQFDKELNVKLELELI